MGEIHWTTAPSVILGRRERKTRTNSCEGDQDIGSVTLNMDFSTVHLFTYEFAY